MNENNGYVIQEEKPEVEDIETTLLSKLVNHYQLIRECVVLGTDLLSDEKKLDQYLREEVEKYEDMYENPSVAKSVRELWLTTSSNSLKGICLPIEDNLIDTIKQDLAYLSVNLPSIENLDEAVPLVGGVTLFTTNMIASSLARITSTPFYIYMSSNVEDPNLKSVFNFLTAYSVVRNLFIPFIPSLPGFVNYFMFSFVEEPAQRALKKLYYNWKNIDMKIPPFESKKLISLPRLILNLEGVGTLALLVQEVLRAYNLNEISLPTIMFIKRLITVERFRREKLSPNHQN